MITADISAYYCFRQLDKYKEVKYKGVIGPRKQPRYDLTLHLGFWGSLDKIKTAKGEVYLTLIPTDKNEYRKQEGTTPEYYLQCRPPKSKSVNFSGIRFEYRENGKPIYGSGEPSDQAKLKGGVVNPLYGNRDDGFLFIFSDNMEQLEIIVINGGRTLIDAYRKQLSLGGFDTRLQEFRKAAKVYSPL